MKLVARASIFSRDRARDKNTVVGGVMVRSVQVNIGYQTYAPWGAVVSWVEMR